MDQVINAGKWVIENYNQVLTGVIGVGASLIGLFLLIPGDQPESFLKKCVDFLAKFSRK